jgi:hypothetical protein
MQSINIVRASARIIFRELRASAPQIGGPSQHELMRSAISNDWPVAGADLTNSGHLYGAQPARDKRVHQSQPAAGDQPSHEHIQRRVRELPLHPRLSCMTICRRAATDLSLESECRVYLSWGRPQISGSRGGGSASFRVNT